MTIKNKANIPRYIYEQYQKYAPGFKLDIFDDEDCKEFLRREYDESYVQKFEELETGAHKADLFRYAYLFKRGGLYMDVKTVLMRDLDKILDDFPTKFVMVKTVNAKQYDIVNDNGSMYNGVIYLPRKHLHQRTVDGCHVRKAGVNHYNRFITSAHTILMSYTLDNHVNFGYIKTNDSIADVFVLQEDFSNPVIATADSIDEANVALS